MKRSQNYSFSIFNIVRQSTFLQKENITKKLQNKENDFNKLIEKVNFLQISVIKKGNNISNQIKEILFFLSSGNNDNTIKQFFYSSKLFIDIIHIFNISLPEYYEDLIVFIHKIICDKLIIATEIYIKPNNFSEIYLKNQKLFF